LAKVKQDVRSEASNREADEAIVKEEMSSQVQTFEERLAKRRAEKGLAEPSASESNDDFKEIFGVLDQLEKENSNILEEHKPADGEEPSG
jgi:hypothetical protein